MISRDWLGFTCGVAVGAGAAWLINRKNSPSSAVAHSDAQYTAVKLAATATNRDNPDIAAEQFSRNSLFLGEEGQQKFNGSFVVVIGLGGVGSHAAHMLARTGVGRLRLVDFDNVTLSSLNRHAVATRDDVGKPKTMVCKERFAEFHPACEIEAIPSMFTAELSDSLLGGSPDYVIDCIDDINTKADLVNACRRLKLPVISALGAGGKSDPTRVVIGDVADAQKDPLANKLRYELRMRAGGEQWGTAEYLKGIKVIYSYEQPVEKLAEMTQEQAEDPSAYGALANFRIRTMPVIGTMPAIFGMMAAGFVICELSGRPFAPKRVEGISESFKKKLIKNLEKRERNVFGNKGFTPIADGGEVAYIVDDVWYNRSALGDRRNCYKGLALTRFDRSKPALPYNLLLAEPHECDAHDEATAVTGGLPAGLDNDKKLQEVHKRLAAIEAAWS